MTRDNMIQDAYFARPANFAVKKDLGLMTQLASASRDSYRQGVQNHAITSTALGQLKSRDVNAPLLKERLQGSMDKLDAMAEEGHYEDYYSEVTKLATEVANDPLIKATQEDYMNNQLALEELAQRRNSGQISDYQYARGLKINEILNNKSLELDPETGAYTNIHGKHIDTQKFVDMNPFVLGLAKSLPKKYLGTKSSTKGGHTLNVDKFGVDENEVRETIVDAFKDPAKDSYLEKEAADDVIVLTKGETITEEMLQSVGLMNNKFDVVLKNLKTGEEVIDDEITNALYNEDGTINQETAFNYLTQKVKGDQIEAHVQNALNATREEEKVSRVKDVLGAERRANQEWERRAKIQSELSARGVDIREPDHYFPKWRFPKGQSSKELTKAFLDKHMENAISSKAVVSVGNLPEKITYGKKTYNTDDLILAERYGYLKDRLDRLSKTKGDPSFFVQFFEPGSEYEEEQNTDYVKDYTPQQKQEKEEIQTKIDNILSTFEGYTEKDLNELLIENKNLLDSKTYSDLKTSATLTEQLQEQGASTLGNLSAKDNVLHKTSDGRYYVEAFVNLNEDTEISSENMENFSQYAEDREYYKSGDAGAVKQYGKMLSVKYEVEPTAEGYLGTSKMYGRKNSNLTSFVSDKLRDDKINSEDMLLSNMDLLAEGSGYDPNAVVMIDANTEEEITIKDIQETLNKSGVRGVRASYSQAGVNRILELLNPES